MFDNFIHENSLSWLDKKQVLFFFTLSLIMLCKDTWLNPSIQPHRKEVPVFHSQFELGSIVRFKWGLDVRTMLTLWSSWLLKFRFCESRAFMNNGNWVWPHSLNHQVRIYCVALLSVWVNGMHVLEVVKL